MVSLFELARKFTRPVSQVRASTRMAIPRDEHDPWQNCIGKFWWCSQAHASSFLQQNQHREAYRLDNVICDYKIFVITIFFPDNCLWSRVVSISGRILQADLLLRTTRSLLRVGDLKLAVPLEYLPASPSPHKDHHLWGHKSLGCARCGSSNHRGQGLRTPPLVSLPLSDRTRKDPLDRSSIYSSRG